MLIFNFRVLNVREVWLANNLLYGSCGHGQSSPVGMSPSEGISGGGAASVRISRSARASPCGLTGVLPQLGLISCPRFYMRKRDLTRKHGLSGHWNWRGALGSRLCPPGPESSGNLPSGPVSCGRSFQLRGQVPLPSWLCFSLHFLQSQPHPKEKVRFMQRHWQEAHCCTTPSSCGLLVDGTV